MLLEIQHWSEYPTRTFPLLKCWTWYPRTQISWKRHFFPHTATNQLENCFLTVLQQSWLMPKDNEYPWRPFTRLRWVLWVSDRLEKCQNLSAVQPGIRYLSMGGFLLTSVELELNLLMTLLSRLSQAQALYKPSLEMGLIQQLFQVNPQTLTKQNLGLS